jgi:putative GTP pyrophosphokinase
VTESRISKSQVDRAGSFLRNHLRDVVAQGQVEVDIPEAVKAEAVEAMFVAREWRQEHERPLSLVTPGVRNWVSQESSQVDVGQRLKRMPAIIRKLLRFPSMRLSQMEDIGGCRAVLATPAEVEAVARRIESRWDVHDVTDYRERGKPKTGYRALHYIVTREDRLIEIQLRTTHQHEWAEQVETLGSRWKLDLKGGEGHPDVLELLRVASDLIWTAESAKPVEEGLMERFENLRDRVMEQFG